MRLSFDDEESFKKAAESLRFNNPPDDRNIQLMGSSGSIPPQDSERNEDIGFNNPTSDPNTLRRMGSSHGSSSNHILPHRRGVKIL